MGRGSEIKIFRYRDWYSTDSLIRKVEEALAELQMEGWEVVSVPFGFDNWYRQNAFVTVRRG